MRVSEWIVIVGGGVLGYWAVAVLWPLLRGPREHRQAPSATDAPQAPAESWHQVLGVPADADRETVDAAYRAKISEYAPERIAGLANEAQAAARERRQQLELAYDAALRDLEWLRPRSRDVPM